MALFVRSRMLHVRHGELGGIEHISGGRLLHLGLLVFAISILPLFHAKFLLYLNYSESDATSTYNPQVFNHLV